MHTATGYLTPHAKNQQTIHAFLADNNVFIMATGRAYHDIQTISKNMGIPIGYAIAMNGALIYKNGKIILAQTLTEDQIKCVMAQLVVSGIAYLELTLFTDAGNIYTLIPSVWRKLRQFVARIKRHYKLRIWKDSYFAKLKTQQERIPKMVIRLADCHQRVALEKKLVAHFGHSLSIYCSSPFVIEICTAGVNKAEAITYIQRREQLRLKEIGFVGDSGNDFCVFTQFPHSYIMTHASVKYHTTYTQPVVDVATALQLFAKNTK